MKLVQTVLAVALLSGIAYATPVQAQTKDPLLAALRSLLDGPASQDDDAGEWDDDKDEDDEDEGGGNESDDNDDDADDNDGDDNDGGDDD